MTKFSFKYFAGISGSIFVGIMFLTMLAANVYAEDELPEVSSDGLHLKKDAKVRVAYVKEGASFSQYTKVKILDCYVEFVEDWQRDYNLHEVGLSGRVSDRDAEEIKDRLAAEFRKIFTEELTEAGHEVVDDTGPDILLLRPAIINLDVNAPDLRTANRGNTWVQSAGQMTLYMEFYDSANNTLLARVVDPQADRGFGTASVSNRVTNRAEADKILRRWANLLETHLGDVKQNAESD